MLHLLKRHPTAVEAKFDYTLVLTYALPADVLKPLLFPGLALETFENSGFVAIAMVEARGLRLKGLPQFVGQDFFLTGYRIFVRYKTAEGKNLRGLRILRSDTDKPLMSVAGNLFTHYQYELASVKRKRVEDRLNIKVFTPSGRGNLEVDAIIGDGKTDAALPETSPFKTIKEARQFEGPLPFTFDFEKETNSIVMVEGVRQDWRPRNIEVDVKTVDFFRSGPFKNCEPRLASAFYIENIPYWWKKGCCEKLPQASDAKRSADD
ncbi:MAG: DUF2071 domain-containing protein [Candidatus Melainabacteria bacterium]|jgi:hypothetical protein|nr:DUF2071 domain-containing protein [Candidatus Melainabacteria bacterium]